MKLMERLKRYWDYFGRFAEAMDDDPVEELRKRVADRPSQSLFFGYFATSRRFSAEYGRKRTVCFDGSRDPFPPFGQLIARWPFSTNSRHCTAWATEGTVSS